MADKKYFWLRLKRDFFKRHDVKILEAYPNGKEYLLLYLKLLCESVDHEGALRFSEKMPYTPEMLAILTDTDEEIVKNGLDVMLNLGLIEKAEDETLIMSGVQKLIGTFENDEHTRESARLRAKAYRERKKEKCDDNVTVTLPSHDSNVIRHGEIEKELEIEKETDIELEKEKKSYTNYQKIIGMYNDTCVSFPKVTSLSDKRKESIRARLNQYDEQDFLTMFQKAECSSFLKGKNNKDWMANFDWMIKDSNMAKILDGNYDDREKKFEDSLHKAYNEIDKWAGGNNDTAGI